MKKTSAITVLVLCILMVGLFTACGEKQSSEPYDFDLSEYITLGDYTGIEAAPLGAVEVTDEDVQTEIDKRIKDATSSETVTEGVVEQGDTINIDYVGTMDGVEFEGGSTKGQGTDIVVGSAGYIDGFEDGLVGVAVGDTVVLDLQFPDPYLNNPDYSGKDCQFTVTVNSKKLMNTPEYNLQWVQSVSDCETIEAYEQSVYDELYEQGLETAKSEQEASVWNTVIENATVIKYPENEMETAIQQYRDYLTNYVSTYGYDLDSYLELMNMTEEDFQNQLNDYGQSVVKNEMVLYAIARAEGFEVSSDEYDEAVTSIIEDAGFSSVKEFEDSYGKDFNSIVSRKDIITSILLNKVMEFVLDNAIINE